MKLTATKIQDQILEIRDNVNVFLIDTAQWLKKIDIQYINGEATPIYAEPVLFNCRVITRSGSESNNIAAQPRETQQSVYSGLYRLQIPYNLPIKEGDLIIITDLLTNEAITYNVIFAPVRRNSTGAVIIQLEIKK